MIDKKLIHFNTYSAFEASKSLLYDWTIAFIKETKQIYTHGTFYDCDDIANIEAIDTNDTIDDPNINYLTTALQSLTDEEKQQVKENIGLNINDFDLSDYATNQSVDTKIAEIPKVTKVSQLENDKNYIENGGYESGIYIAVQSGKLINPDEYDSTTETAVGVAVITDNSSFIIGRVATHKSSIAWSSNTSTDLTSVPTSTSSSTIATNYDGVAYTNAMIAAGSAYNTTSYAAGYARSKTITFNGSTLTGYLGSAGEWQDALNNRAAILNAFSVIGDTFVASDGYKYFWASCEYSSYDAWSAYFNVAYDDFALYCSSKGTSDSDYCVVPFYKISFPSNLTKINTMWEMGVLSSNSTIKDALVVSALPLSPDSQTLYLITE